MAAIEATLERIKAVKAAALVAGIVLTPQELYKAANKKQIKKMAKRRRKLAKKGRGWSPVLPGSFESSSR
jgi:uncharacterized protein YktB (UPF0637 family)